MISTFEPLYREKIKKETNNEWKKKIEIQFLLLHMWKNVLPFPFYVIDIHVLHIFINQITVKMFYYIRDIQYDYMNILFKLFLFFRWLCLCSVVFDDIFFTIFLVNFVLFVYYMVTWNGNPKCVIVFLLQLLFVHEHMRIENSFHVSCLKINLQILIM